MTRGERRKARKAARAEGKPLRDELALEVDRDGPACEFSETARGYQARHRWARRYDDLNGAPEGPWDC
jgi:hypothetical protein